MPSGRVLLTFLVLCSARDADAQLCQTSSVHDPWEVMVKWEWGLLVEGGHYHASVIHTPLVAQLDDDNGDGVIDGDDKPEVIIVEDDDHGGTIALGRTAIIDGLTGTTKRIIHAPPNYGYLQISGMAIVELSTSFGSSGPEIVTVARLLNGGPGPIIQAFRPNGTTLWTTPHVSTWPVFPDFVVADIDFDGTTEVIVDNSLSVLNGQTGVPEMRFATPGMGSRIHNSEPHAADLDLAGTQEIFFGPYLLDTGSSTASVRTPVWTASISYSHDVYPVLVQYDADPEPEISYVTEVGYYLFDDNLALLASTPLPHSRVGAPCTGDFDGDGTMELAWVRGTDATIVSMELDGTLRWTVTATIYRTSCSAFDLDADGDDELLYGSISGLSIHDGHTGAILVGPLGHEGGNWWASSPSVADVDGDGHSEILVSHGAYDTPGVTVYRHRGSGWAPSGTGWGVAQYRGLITPNGELSTDTRITGRLRSRPVGPTCGDGFRDVCEECDDGNRFPFDGCSRMCELEALPDAGFLDAAAPDASTPDADPLDAGLAPDAEPVDAEELDAPADAVAPDATSNTDAVPTDVVSTDTGVNPDATPEILDALGSDTYSDAGVGTLPEEEGCSCTGVLYGNEHLRLLGR